MKSLISVILAKFLVLTYTSEAKIVLRRKKMFFIAGGTDCRWEDCSPGNHISQTRGCRTGETQDQRNTSMRASASHFLVEKLNLPQPSLGLRWSSPSVVRGGDWEQERGGPGWPDYLLARKRRMSYRTFRLPRNFTTVEDLLTSALLKVWSGTPKAPELLLGGPWS